MEDNQTILGLGTTSKMVLAERNALALNYSLSKEVFPIVHPESAAHQLLLVPQNSSTLGDGKNIPLSLPHA